MWRCTCLITEVSLSLICASVMAVVAVLIAQLKPVLGRQSAQSLTCQTSDSLRFVNVYLEVGGF